MRFSLFTLLLFVLLISCSHERKKIKKIPIKDKFYELKIISKGQFTASLTLKNPNKKKGLLKFNSNDSIGDLWHIQINALNNWYLDTSIYVRSISNLKVHLNYIFGKIPYEAPKNCNFIYKNKKFEPIEAKFGNQIDTSKLNKQIILKIKSKQINLSLNYENAFKRPKFTLKDKAAKEGLIKLNKCLKAEITYILRANEVKVTKKDFAEWLTLDSNMNVDLITAKSARFIQKIARDFDVVEKTINFTTYAGEKKKIDYSELGTRIDVYRELNRLQKDIESGAKVVREPIYGMKGIPNGAFDTNKNYVEVSISDQKLWLYRDGQLISESNIVTGCPRKGHATPSGAFYVKYKDRNAILDGPGYRTHVRYWMPFNKGVGLHDARWRRKFGGEVYKADGSHGCVNLPLTTAQLLYQHIEPGSIVICY